jgi:hypothetical protein
MLRVTRNVPITSYWTPFHVTNFIFYVSIYAANERSVTKFSTTKHVKKMFLVSVLLWYVSNQVSAPPNLNMIHHTLVPQPIFHTVNTSINFPCMLLPIVVLTSLLFGLYHLQIQQYTHKYSTRCRQNPVLASVFVLEVLCCIGTESDICLCISFKYLLHILKTNSNDWCTFLLYIHLRHMQIFLYDGWLSLHAVKRIILPRPTLYTTQPCALPWICVQQQRCIYMMAWRKHPFKSTLCDVTDGEPK